MVLYCRLDQTPDPSNSSVMETSFIFNPFYAFPTRIKNPTLPFELNNPLESIIDFQKCSKLQFCRLIFICIQQMLTWSLNTVSQREANSTISLMDISGVR